MKQSASFTASRRSKTLSPPRRTPTAIQRPDEGIAVWALQRALNSLPWSHIPEDGVFGNTTAVAVRQYQSTRNLVPDEVVGPQTQARLARSLIAVADKDRVLPDGLARSIVEGESTNFIAAVNWMVPGGVDVGYTQRRLYEPLTTTAIKRGFDSKHQLVLMRKQLVERKQVFRKRPAVSSDERAWRLAILNHNYPLAADRISRTKEKDLTSYWTTPQKWVVAIGARFADGTPVVTPLQWCQRYSLGDHHGEPRMTKYVKEWT